MRQLLLFFAACGLLLFARPGLAQTWQWATCAQGATGTGPVSGQSFVLASAPDGAGNTVVVGNFSGTLLVGAFTLTSAGDRDIFVARLSATGAWLQAVRAGGAGKDLALTVAVAANGTAVVSGSYGGRVSGAGSNLAAQFGSLTLPTPTGEQEAYVARLSATGTWTQAVRANGNGLGDGEVTSLVLDGSGNALVGGYFSGYSYTFGTTTLANSNQTTYSREGFVARLSAAGVWGQATAVGGSTDDFVTAVALDAAGNALVGGTFYSPTLSLGTTTLTNSDATSLTTDLFVGRLSPAGTWLQAARAGGSKYEFLTALVPEADGGLAIAASFASPTASFGALSVANATTSTTAPAYDLVVARQNAAGTWTQAVGVGGPGDDLAEALSAESSGTLTVAGHFNSASLSFGSSTVVNAGSTAEKIFVARLSPAGSWLRAVTAESSSDAEALSVCANGGSSVTVSGFIGGITTFGSTTVNPIFYGKCFVARLVDLPLPTSPSAAASPLRLFPNPATSQATLTLPAEAAPRPVQLLDALGREVRRFTLPAQATALALDLAGLPGGTYLLRCGASAGRLVLE